MDEPAEKEREKNEIKKWKRSRKKGQIGKLDLLCLQFKPCITCFGCTVLNYGYASEAISECVLAQSQNKKGWIKRKREMIRQSRCECDHQERGEQEVREKGKKLT